MAAWLQTGQCIIPDTNRRTYKKENKGWTAGKIKQTSSQHATFSQGSITQHRQKSEQNLGLKGPSKQGRVWAMWILGMVEGMLFQMIAALREGLVLVSCQTTLIPNMAA